MHHLRSDTAWPIDWIKIESITGVSKKLCEETEQQIKDIAGLASEAKEREKEGNAGKCGGNAGKMERKWRGSEGKRGGGCNAHRFMDTCTL